MKKAINLILVYLLILIIGIISVTFLYSFYLNVLDYIAGKNVILFSNDVLLKSLIYSSYSILLFICPIMSYYRIRRQGGIPQTVAFIIIVLLTWGLFFPGITHVENLVNREYSQITEVTHLTKGYFRKIDKKVYYFTRDFESVHNNVATSTAVIIDTNENGSVETKTVRDLSTMEFNKKAAPFKDVLVKQNFDNSRITIPVNLKNLFANVCDCIEFNLYYLLYYISIALVLSSVYALTGFFNWKLLNAVLIFFVTVLIVSVNSAYDQTFIGTLLYSVSELPPFQFLSKYIYDSVLFVINCFFGLVFIVTGIVKFAIHNHAKKN